ncbi:hypothetical protein [Catenuloplanes indicus]|uniref:Uncharacterized protein n=1 Tax=Catenuloplanes indicus TaxID=137267 RepID=A0AAE3VTL9_9ACTN|nr:hypothetical protein [Catenuloplanes indicus]MDQ0363410.1 hypothetical protein [Catenuloplanes indicus]
MPEIFPEAHVMAEIDRLNERIQQMQAVVDAATKWRQWYSGGAEFSWDADRDLAAAVDAFQSA